MTPLLSHWEGEAVESLRERWGVPALEVHESIGSTNDRALVLAAAPRAAFSVVIGLEQTAGRGRRGADWHSAPGAGLWMSVVLPAAPSAVPAAPHLPLLVGLAVAEGVEDAAREAEASVAPVAIKWPNDLLVGARKLGGILCESASGAVVAGIGVNVKSPPGGFPEALRSVATSLEAEGCKRLSSSRLAGSILRRLEVRCGTPSGRLGADALAALRARDALLGRPVTTEERGPGVAAGLAEDGALLLERADGSRVRVVSGSVRPS